MPNTKTILQSLLLASLLFSCSNRHEKSQIPHVSEPSALDETNATAPASIEIESGLSESRSTTLDAISSSAAVENKSDTTRKFIRTADLKFRVQDVAKATYALEDIVARFGGFVTYTNLTSNITRQSLIPVSADSSLETIYYVVENILTLRVPQFRLDSTLKAFVPVIDYLDHRILHADDVQFQLLENRLKRERAANYEERVTNAIDERGKKLQETTHAEDKILGAQEQADEALLENMKLKDKIAFSTIQLHIYQRETFRRELIANDKNTESYHPGFFAQLSEALRHGWKLLEGIFLFFAKSWGILLFAAVAVAGIKILFFRRKSSTEF